MIARWSSEPEECQPGPALAGTGILARQLTLGEAAAFQHEAGERLAGSVTSGPDLAQAIRDAILAPLGLPEDKLPSYEATPPGCCRICHLGPRADAYQALCAYCLRTPPRNQLPRDQLPGGGCGEISYRDRDPGCDCMRWLRTVAWYAVGITTSLIALLVTVYGVRIR